MVFSLRLLGGVSLDGDGASLTGPAVQRHRLGLLALLAVGRPRAPTRDKLMALLWPERDTERARGLLNQAVHVLRRTLGPEAVLSTGEELRLNPGLVWCDVTAFEEGISAGELERAAGWYAGPFLDGFFLSDAPEFERWAERERERMAAAFAGVLESLAEKAGAQKDSRRAADWWKRRVAHDPYDSRAVARLMLALEASGNRGAAILHAEAHQRMLREDLGLESSPEVLALAERLRSSPAESGPWLPPESAAVPARLPASPTGDRPVAETPAPPAPAQSTPKRPLLRYGVIATASIGTLLAAIRLGSDRIDARVPATASPIAVDEIARAVANELDRRQRGDTGVRLPQHRTSSIPAYELYLRGSDPSVLRTDSSARQALEYFRRAVALDSNYAAAWAGLARLTMRVGFLGNAADFPQVQARADAAARRAIALDDSLAEAHATLALIRMRAHNLPGAEAALRRAIALDPRVALHREWLVKLHIWAGRPEEALAEAQRAVQLTPMSPTANAELARALLANGRCDEALARLASLTGLEPPLARVAVLQAMCYAQKGMWPEAIEAIRPEGGVDDRVSGLFGYLLARGGRRDEASKMLDALVEADRTGGGMSWSIALVYLGLGDLTQALPWLDRSVENGTLAAVSEHGPLARTLLDSLRGDPRIARIRQRLGLLNR
jgi:DNA-binding SARP family transcriptional activator